MAINENPTTIPRVPPTVPTRDIKVTISYSVLTVLNGLNDLRSRVECGVAKFKVISNALD